MPIINGVEIKWLGHSGFKIEYAGYVIYIDPFVLPESERENADYILVTHEHFDHFSVDTINKIMTEKTSIIAPPSCIGKVEHDINIILPGEKKVFDFFELETVPAYNKEKKFHSKDNGYGYILNIKGTKIYHAGDTDFIPEMAALKKKHLHIALLPVGGTYTMDVREAVKAVEAIMPVFAFPMHYGTLAQTSANIDDFKKRIENRGVNVKVLVEWR